MIPAFRERSPTASSRDETTSIASSREKSRSLGDSDYGSTVSSRDGARTLDGIKLELELRTERIKEVENAYEELRRKSEFDAGELRFELQQAADQYAKALETIEELKKSKDTMEEGKWHVTNQAAEIAVQMQSSLKAARAEGEKKMKALQQHNSLEACNPNTANSSPYLLEAKQKCAAAEKSLKEEKQRAAESLKAVEAEKQKAIEAEKQKAAESLKALEVERSLVRELKATKRSQAGTDVAVGESSPLLNNGSEGRGRRSFFCLNCSVM